VWAGKAQPERRFEETDLDAFNGMTGLAVSCDRDWAAAERIVSRGLLAQKATFTTRTTGIRQIRTVVDTVVEGNVARARRAKKATRAARRAQTDLHP
jgi:hypothetical protein